MSEGLLIMPNVFEFSVDDERMNAFTNFLSQTSKSKNSQNLQKRFIPGRHSTIPRSIPCFNSNSMQEFRTKSLIHAPNPKSLSGSKTVDLMFHDWGSPFEAKSVQYTTSMG
jgi:hypothetical protein